MPRLFVLALVLLALAGDDPPRSSKHPSTSAVASAKATLREVAQHAGVLIGAAVRPQRFSEPAYAATVGREFNMVEAEDAMKWEVIHPSLNGFDFSLADRVVAFAAEHRMNVRGHTLVWHRQNPEWLTSERRNSVGLSRILESHIKAVMGHFRGKVFAWDVVNEAFDEDGSGNLRSTIWYDQPGIGLAGEGTAYIEQCFRWAHAADPQALLFYNDAGAEEINPKSDAIYTMVRSFKQRGVPIDGVGLQMHLSNLHPDLDSIARNIARFTALGVQIHITEMDVALPVDANGDATTENLAKQAKVYRNVSAACLQYSLCTAIQTWGFTDRYSWIGSHSRYKEGAALLFSKDYRPKPAYDAVMDALSQPR